MAAESVEVQTIISAVLTLTGSVAGGAFVWWLKYLDNRKVTRGEVDVARINAGVQEHKNLFEAFDEFSGQQTKRIEQLVAQVDTVWAQLKAEREHSRTQDIALRDCEKCSKEQSVDMAKMKKRDVERDVQISNLQSVNRRLERRIAMLEPRVPRISSDDT